VFILSSCQTNSPTEEFEKSPDTPTGISRHLPTATRDATIFTPTPIELSEEWKLWNESPHKSTKQGVNCVNCHDGVEKNISNGYILCMNCHSVTLKVSQPTNMNKLAHSELNCLSCHNPHSTQTSCSNAGCHDKIRKPEDMPPATPGSGHPSNSSFCGGANCHPAATEAAISNPTIHGAKHAGVSCIACHDASGLKVGPSKAFGMWVTYQSREDNSVSVQEPYFSHNLQSIVDCTRCHYEQNEWKLPLVTGHEFGN